MWLWRLSDLIEMSVAGVADGRGDFSWCVLLLALAVLGYERLSSETNVTIPLLADFVVR